MDFQAPLYKASLIRRYAKVLADVRMETGEKATAFCSNTTRLKTLSDPGTEIYLSFCPRPNRRLQLIWELACANGTLVGVNMGRQTDLAAEAIIDNTLYELSGYEKIEADPSPFFDLLLIPPSNSGYPLCHVAVASVYEKKGADLLFPDTIAVANHHILSHLEKALENKERAVLILLAQRIDCMGVRAQWTADASYLVRLKELYDNKGLEILCCGCSVSQQGIWVTARLPFIF
ncbi:MAG: DNA/RNA nuclease SfsA [Alphaproteobacteria bacterium]|nr:DNA/RNA nuclease SfsA [Alphaproteobacteria bacterium]